jgi:hypothetical protein
MKNHGSKKYLQLSFIDFIRKLHKVTYLQILIKSDYAEIPFRQN